MSILSVVFLIHSESFVMPKPFKSFIGFGRKKEPDDISFGFHALWHEDTEGGGMISRNKVIYFWPNLVCSDWAQRFDTGTRGVIGVPASLCFDIFCELFACVVTLKLSQ